MITLQRRPNSAIADRLPDGRHYCRQRLFAGHWREHLTQLRELRAALGV